jgi:hypothetical protein
MATSSTQSEFDSGRVNRKNSLVRPKEIDRISLDQAAFVTERDQLVSARNILERGPSRRVRNLIHDLVHGFRAAHGLSSTEYLPDNPIYHEVLSFYCKQLPLVPERTAIRKVGSPKFYEAVRSADNGKLMFESVSRRGMIYLTREIRAAFVWSQLRTSAVAAESR